MKFNFDFVVISSYSGETVKIKREIAEKKFSSMAEPSSLISVFPMSAKFSSIHLF